MDKLPGISLSEENVGDKDHAPTLQYLYDEVKKKYPSLRVFQWWTPDTSVPCRVAGRLLSAEGWVIDPYGLCAARYPQGPTVKRLIQKYLVTGAPLVFVLNASNEGPLQALFPAVLNEQLQACSDFNLPTVFYWTYQKEGGKDSTTLFGHPTGNALMDRISERVFEWTRYAHNLPKNFSGNPKVADTWDNPPLKVMVHPGMALYRDDFTESRFLDESGGEGFRDLVWDGTSLAARGFQGRKTAARWIYHLVSHRPLRWPRVVLQAETERDLNGVAQVALSRNGGESWPVRAQTSRTGGRQTLSVESRARGDFEAVNELWVKVDLRGMAGSLERPPVRIRNLAVLAADEAAEAAAIDANLLDIDFAEGYREGALAGQAGGVNGGPWKAGPGAFEIQSRIALPGGRALSSSRTDGGSATILLAGNLDTARPMIYFAADVYRVDDRSQGTWVLINSKSGANVGIGFSIGSGAHPVLRHITGKQFKSLDTRFIIENKRWYRIEIEADGVTHRCNLYAQEAGKPGRTLVAENVPWEIQNRFVDEFMIYPGGQMESVMVSDHFAVWTVTGFPVNRPLSKSSLP
jgi:hypothetical protein